MLSRNLGWWRKLVLALPLVPVAFALEHAGPRGIPTAEGCSGGFSFGEGWAELRVSASKAIEGEDGVTRSAIASDGFVVLDGEYDDHELDIDVSGIHATMTNAEGVEVPGTLRLLRAVSGFRSSHGKTVYLGWEPGSTFQVGERLSLAVTAARAPGQPDDVLHKSFELEVAGPPTPLSDVVMSLRDWVELEHGVGDTVSCDDGSSCGPISVKTSLELLLAVGAYWDAPQITGMVAWEASVELTEPAFDAGEPSDSTIVLGTQKVSPVRAGRLLVPTDTESVCAVTVVRDLRTGAEVRSTPLCEDVAEPTDTVTDNFFEGCSEPPSAELTERWCESHRGDETVHEACRPAGSGGAGGAGQGGAADGGDQPENVGGDGPVASPAKASSSGGCQYGAGRSGGAAAMLGVALSLALLSRRRFGRRPFATKQ